MGADGLARNEGIYRPNHKHGIDRTERYERILVHQRRHCDAFFSKCHDKRPLLAVTHIFPSVR